jgi:CheY-like chemotaxis protein
MPTSPARWRSSSITRATPVRLEPDGPAALRAGAEWQPDLVVLDLGLPTLDGLDVCRRLIWGGVCHP